MSNINYYPLNTYPLHRKHIPKIREWLNEFNNNCITSQCLTIIGPSGSGKTCLANSLFKEHNQDILYFCPDYHKTHKEEMKKLDEMLNGNNILMMIQNIKKGILFDDIDIGSSGDRGFITDVISYLEQNIKKKKKINNPLIITLSNSKINAKKLKSLEKVSTIINLSRPTYYELLEVAKNKLNDEKIEISDIILDKIVKNSQGDLRNLLQKIEITIDSRKPCDTKNEEEIEKESWDLYSSKNIELNSLPTLERYMNPKINIKNEDIEYLYYQDPLFLPAFVYENTRRVLDNIKVKKEIINNSYSEILNSLVYWSDYNSNFQDSQHSFIKDYNVFFSMTKPICIIRELRKDNDYKYVYFKTSNLYSRISQSSFNSRSLCELSSQLNIHTNHYHLCTFTIYQLLSKNFKKVLPTIIEYFCNSGIKVSDIDRIFRYNCLSKLMTKEFNKKKTIIKKKLLTHYENNLSLPN